VVVTNEVTILLANLSVTNDKKVAQTDRPGQTNPTMMTSPKETKSESLMLNRMMMEDGIEIEKDSEVLEFDDSSEVDYDLDYTVQY
tara:strand:+ start:774 stop:1031 length:258 start_codon:yes stop_codon:yes gene_type:complete